MNRFTFEHDEQVYGLGRVFEVEAEWTHGGEVEIVGLHEIDEGGDYHPLDLQGISRELRAELTEAALDEMQSRDEAHHERLMDR